MPTKKERLEKYLDRIGYDLVSVENIGMDPWTYCIRGIVTGQSQQTKQFATWDMYDWTKHPTSEADRKRGIYLEHGHYGFNRANALSDAKDRASDLLENYDWIDPDTHKKII